MKPKAKRLMPGDVEHETLFHAEGHIFFRLRLEPLRVGEFVFGEEQQQDGEKSWDCQHGKGVGIGGKGIFPGAEEHHHIEEHRTKKRADLVQQLLNPKAFANPLLGGGKRTSPCPLPAF